jgi:outer membrane protein OmpA-like peptidoglycan-associated protein
MTLKTNSKIFMLLATTWLIADFPVSAVSNADVSANRYLDHDQTVAQGGVGNIVDVPIRAPHQEAGSYEGKAAGVAGTSTAAMEDLTQRSMIHFDEGDAKVDSHAETKLKKVADELNKDPNLQVVVEGHADSTGDKSVNHALSEARANSVKSALISEGVKPSQIETYGFGASEPVATNSTVDGRAKNRRAELYLEDMEATT